VRGMYGGHGDKDNDVQSGNDKCQDREMQCNMSAGLSGKDLRGDVKWTHKVSCFMQKLEDRTFRPLGCIHEAMALHVWY
jgi:hypothetical protein